MSTDTTQQPLEKNAPRAITPPAETVSHETDRSAVNGVQTHGDADAAAASRKNSSNTTVQEEDASSLLDADGETDDETGTPAHPVAQIPTWRLGSYTDEFLDAAQEYYVSRSQTAAPSTPQDAPQLSPPPSHVMPTQQPQERTRSVSPLAFGEPAPIASPHYVSRSQTAAPVTAQGASQSSPATSQSMPAQHQEPTRSVSPLAFGEPAPIAFHTHPDQSAADFVSATDLHAWSCTDFVP